MSSIEQHSEETRKVVINQEDIKNIREFFTHFQIEMPDTLKAQLDIYDQKGKDYTFEDQVKLRAYIANAMITSEHPLFKDPIFDNIRKMSQDAWYHEQFKLDLEQALTSDN